MKTSVAVWRNPEQFKKTYKYAYDDDLTKKRWAVEQMAVWETRCWPSLPFAVEATALCVKAEIQDILFQADKTLCQAKEIEMLYSTAILRFVSLFVENERSTGERKAMKHIAEEKNIPSWVIDVRHNIAHGHGPTLPVCRMACQAIMDYLELIFWEPESSRVSLLVKQTDKKALIEMFEEYRQLIYQKMKQQWMISKKKSIKAYRVACGKISKILSKLGEQRKFLEVLVHPDYFVTRQDIDMAVKRDSDFASLVPDETNMKLPEDLKKFWNPILHSLHSHNCISTFMELLLLSQEHRHVKIYQKVADSLVLYILDNASFSNVPSSSFWNGKSPLLNYQRLLYCCMKGQSTFSHIVFIKLSNHLELGPWQDELSVMLSMKRGLTVSKNAEKEGRGEKRKFDITFTVGDIEEDAHLEMAAKNPSFKKNPWYSAPISIDFSSVPLGHVFKTAEPAKVEEPKQEMEVKETVNISKTEEVETLELPSPKPMIPPLIRKVPARSSLIYSRKKIN